MKSLDIIFDIDGTLADINHRRKYVEGKKSDWDKFYELMDLDIVNEPVAWIYDLINNDDAYHTNILICTGRPEEYREVTEEWLGDNDINFTELLMRPTGNYEPDNELKEKMLGKLQRLGYDPKIVFDDRDKIVKMWRDNGLQCFQVADGDF